MFVTRHQIAGLNLLTEADIDLNKLITPVYSKFQTEEARTDIHFRIQELIPDLHLLPPLTSLQKEYILRTIGFPSQWIDRPVLRSPQVRNAINACLEHPDMAQIGLRWERVIIRNFAMNELDLFYPSSNKELLNSSFFISPHRTMVAVFLPTFSAVMLHGAGIIRNGSAMLFLAPDEGGKSTITNLAASMPVLNDDHIILRKQAGMIVAHGTPFGKLSSGPEDSRLGAIFLVEKSSNFVITRLSPSEAIKFIWTENEHQWLLMPKKLRIRAFELIVDACQQARIYRMQFPKRFVDWNLIDKAIQAD
jgi:hypothetical protein